MTFSDDDLKRLKEEIEADVESTGMPMTRSYMKRLLARMEASEIAVKYLRIAQEDDGQSIEYSAGVRDEADQAYEAWRKAEKEAIVEDRKIWDEQHLLDLKLHSQEAYQKGRAAMQEEILKSDNYRMTIWTASRRAALEEAAKAAEGLSLTYMAYMDRTNAFGDLKKRIAERIRAIALENK